MSDRRRDDRRASLRPVPSGDGVAPSVPSSLSAIDAERERVRAQGEVDDLTPPTDEELEAAAALRERLEESGEGAALRAAFSPATLSHADHERLLTRALHGDGSNEAAKGPHELPLAMLSPEPTRAEERSAAALRVRIDRDLRPDPDAEPDDEVEGLVDVAVALRSAHSPPVLDELSEARIRKGALASPRRRLRAVVTAFAAVAVAAAAAFAMMPRLGPEARSTTASLVPSRSTQELFDPAEPFPLEGGTSERIDRIAKSRTADLRANRFARWGIR